MPDKRINKVAITYYALIKAKKITYNAIVGLLLLMFKQKSRIIKLNKLY